MKLNLSNVWAIGATAIALVLAGMHLERLTNSSREAADTALRAKATEPGGKVHDDRAVVPDWLRGKPREWRSPFNGAREGYAILLDYDRRSLLIDSCAHHGFFDADANRPAKPQGPRCERVMTATVLEFTDNALIAQLNNGQTVEVGVSLNETGGTTVLDLSIEERRMQLIPGQTNDLFSDIADTPQMQAELQQLFDFSLQQQRQLRAQLADAGSEVPRFTVPDSVLENNGTVGSQNKR